jgi:hypothetical protein
MIMVPAIAYEFLFRAFVHPNQNSTENGFGNNDVANVDGYLTARAITFGIFVALALVVYIPVGIWKSRVC